MNLYLMRTYKIIWNTFVILGEKRQTKAHTFNFTYFLFIYLLHPYKLCDIFIDTWKIYNKN